MPEKCAARSCKRRAKSAHARGRCQPQHNTHRGTHTPSKYLYLPDDWTRRCSIGQPTTVLRWAFHKGARKHAQTQQCPILRDSGPRIFPFLSRPSHQEELGHRSLVHPTADSSYDRQARSMNAFPFPFAITSSGSKIGPLHAARSAWNTNPNQRPAVHTRTRWRPWAHCTGGDALHKQQHTREVLPTRGVASLPQPSIVQVLPLPLPSQPNSTPIRVPACLPRPKCLSLAGRSRQHCPFPYHWASPKRARRWMKI